MIISTSVFLITLLISNQVHGELRHYDFTLTEDLLNPDCHSEGYISPLINGQFPGPAIYANQDDDVEVLINNQLSYNASIHFHGIRQFGTAESDGVPGVTQNPIPPGATFLHRFRLIEQAGTYFYHAHVGLQDDSVQGPLVVYESKDANPKERKKKKGAEKQQQLVAGPHKYDDELVLQMSEWWHESLGTREQYYLGPDFAYDKGADSILFNGKTIHDQDAPGLSEDTCKGYVSLNVNPNTRYRLRVIGGNTFRTLGLAIKNHNLTIIEVDGGLVQPYTVSYLEVTPGQRFSVLLDTGDYDPDSTFAIATTYLWRQRGRGYTKNGYGYLRYKKPIWDEEDHLFQLFPDAPIQPPKDEEAGGWGNNNREDGDDEGSNIIEVHGGKGDSDKQNVAEFYKDNNHYEDDYSDDDHWDHEEEDGEEDKEYHWHHWHHDDEDGEGDGWDHWRDDDVKDRESDINYAHMHGADLIFKPKNTETQHKQGGGGGGGGGGSGRGGNDKPVAIFDKLPEFPAQDLRNWYWHDLVSVKERDPIIDLKDVKTIKLKSTMKRMEDNTTRYFINDREPHMRDMCALDEVKKHSYKQIFTIDSDYDTALDAYSVGYNQTVDLVFQNSIHDGGCLLHPWHTHGHSHYLLASGEGEYIHDKHKDIRTFDNPLYKDVSVVYPSHPSDDEEAQGCGWTKVRIFTNNPGLWAVHCHITTHMLMGKMVILEEAFELIEKHKLYN